MAGSARLEQRQTQSLTVTPQLREAIKLLELPSLELVAYVDQALLENPLLSVEEFTTDPGQDQEIKPSSPDPFEAVAASDYDNLWTHSAEALPSRSSSSFNEDRPDFLNQLAAKPLTLRDHLLQHLNASFSDPLERLIGAQLIDSLDPAGYLPKDLTGLARTLGCSLTQISRLIPRLQQFEPAGVFAQSLAECLRLQLEDRKKLTPLYQAFLDNLSLLETGEVQKLCKTLKIDSAQLSEMIKEIRLLDPKPGLQFDFLPAETLIPDVFVVCVRQEWKVKLNEAAMPRLLIERGFKPSSQTAQKEDLKNYLQHHLGHAQWLIKALEQRVQTIYAVATEIVRTQEEFFERGVAFLKPLVLRDIANALSVHESTISRVTTQKYMSTPRGIYEFKYFFSQGIASVARGEEVASQTIKHWIQTLIQAESPHTPYSDDDLVDLLAQQGITVARRTVAKYRKLLHIPSSYKRHSVLTKI